MPVRICLSLLLFVSMSSRLSAQIISGTVLNTDKTVLPAVSVGLLNLKDSSVIKWVVTDANGQFVFTFVNPGAYFVTVSHVNYNKYYSEHFDFPGTGERKLAPIMLTPFQKELTSVTVSSKKPIIEVKADKTILNVEGTINATGTDVLELLKKSPGVLVDKDDNITMSGKNGVQIYIDGRQTPLTAKDLAEYLKSIPSAQVETIELITNPSARYDAAGNAGIINIRLKKNKAFGTNGSVNGGYSVGVYPKYNGGISLNHRKNKINVFGNYNSNIPKSTFSLNIDRHILDTQFLNSTRFDVDFASHSYKTGIDFFINKKNTLGLLINGVIASGNLKSASYSRIFFEPTGVLQKILKAYNQSEFRRNNITANVNYVFRDSLGRELSMDADYSYYKIRTDQFQPNYYYAASGINETSRKIYHMIAPNDIYIKTLKTDYTMPFKKGQLSAGGKASFIESRNDFRRFDVYPGFEQLDTLKSNKFTYRENINALYVNFSRSIKTVIIQVGTRIENTNTRGHSSGQRLDNMNNYTAYDSSFTRHYTDIFPSAAITFSKSPASQWSLSYSRRIDRPTYQSINPFEFRIDEYTFQKGNTQLRPQYSNNFSLTHVYKNTLTTKLSYGHIKNIFTQIIDTAEKSKVFLTQRNLADQNIVSLDVSYILTQKWYSGFFNFSSFYSHYLANFGEGRKVDQDVVTASVFMQNSAKLGKGWAAEITGNYTSPTIIQGTFRLKTLWGIDAGISKMILKNKGSIKVAVSDIFRTRQPVTTSNFAGQSVTNNSSTESRLFRVNFSYRFGSTQVKSARQRKTGAEDELNRVQQNNQ